MTIPFFRNFFQIIFLFTFALAGAEASAFKAEEFSMKSFQSAQASGSKILVDVYANWCPTCKQQHKDLASYFGGSKNKDVKLFKLNYDNKSLVSEFSKAIGQAIPRQSTIVILQGAQVKKVSVAQTKGSLKADLDGALGN